LSQKTSPKAKLSLIDVFPLKKPVTCTYWNEIAKRF
jgi:hypothetical protein